VTADELVDVWTERWPRPDAITNIQNRQMTKRFGQDFRFRELSTIDRSEAREWALDNPSCARYVCTMLNDAVDDDLLERNVFSALRLPGSRGRKDITVPTEDQIDALTLAAEAPLDTMIPFAAYTGIRLGEHRALQRDSFLGDSRIAVHFQLDRTETRKAPKGKRGERLAMVPDRVRHIESMVLALEAPEERPWPLSLPQFKRRWKTTRAATGIWIQWHELRHFCATWLLNKGNNAEDIAIQFGHDDGGQLVRELYGHPDRDLALARLEASLR
jgi:integrase